MNIKKEVLSNKPVIFLDIDGVLNHELFYIETHENCIEEYRKELDKIKEKNSLNLPYKKRVCYRKWKCKRDIDINKINMLNIFCNDNSIDVVISSTWRYSGTIEYELLEAGATFKIAGKTPSFGSSISCRGMEIKSWLEENRRQDFMKYAILDDDSDMLYEQRNNFFLVDRYCGITPNILYKIERLFKTIL